MCGLPEGQQGPGAENSPGDGDVAAAGVELHGLPLPGAAETAALGGGAPDVQASAGGADLDVGAGVELDEVCGRLGGPALLVQAVVQVDAADAFAQDVAQPVVARRGLLVGAPGGRVAHRGAPSRARVEGDLGGVVVDPPPGLHHGGRQRAGRPLLLAAARPVRGHPAPGGAEPRPGPLHAADLPPAPGPLARPHTHYCNAKTIASAGFS